MDWVISTTVGDHVGIPPAERFAFLACVCVRRCGCGKPMIRASGWSFSPCDIFDETLLRSFLNHSTNLLCSETVNDLIELYNVLVKRHKRTRKDILPYECRVTGVQARW
jgi:hypothetical protein